MLKSLVLIRLAEDLLFPRLLDQRLSLCLNLKKCDKGMKFKTDLSNSKFFVRPHVCHHCGVSGHIRPNCFKLYPHKQLSKRSQVSSQGPTPLFGELLKALSFLTQFQENLNSSMSFNRHTRTRAFSFSCLLTPKCRRS